MAEKLYTLPQTVPAEQLINLLPHKSKMFLLDRLTQHDTDARTLESDSLVTKEHIFYDKEMDGVPSYVAFEMIAQSISALSGVTGYEIGNVFSGGETVNGKNVERFKTTNAALEANQTTRNGGLTQPAASTKI